ncbi:hypothetical protein LUU34_01149700 [Aix galericulata]|nr:hypothetical protein LUU34_01149700 [Aix galericulata]
MQAVEAAASNFALIHPDHPDKKLQLINNCKVPVGPEVMPKEKAANDKKEDKKAATKGKKGAKGKDETKQEDAKEENHSENGDTKTNEEVSDQISGAGQMLLEGGEKSQREENPKWRGL